MIIFPITIKISDLEKCSQMTSTPAVVFVSCMQILLRTSIFFEQSGDLCSPAPSISSWIFLIAFLDLLSDLCIYPMRYMHLPYFCQVIVETLIAILLTEFGALVVWCTMEKVVCRLVKSMLLVLGLSQRTYGRWETLILGAVTTAISIGILAFVGQATDHFHMLRKKYSRLVRKIALTIEGLWYRRYKTEHKGRSNRSHNNSDYFHSQDLDDETASPKRRTRRRGG